MLVNKKIKKTELQSLLNESSGKGYTIIERIKKGIYGSQQYRIISIRNNKLSDEFEESSDIVYSNLEIRKKGISLHFRFKNEEYLDCCHFNKLKIMSNDNVLTLQIENSIYKLQYKNPKQNNLLIKKIYNEKIYFNKKI